MKQRKQLLKVLALSVLMMIAYCGTIRAQGGVTIRGTVTDTNNEALIGASIVVKGNSSLGTVSDLDGHFTIF